MAQQTSLVKIEGTIEDLTFYKKDGKNLVRKKGGISKERIMNEPNFVRTRENGAEFSHSGSSGKLLRQALGSMVFKAKDSKLSSRLLQVMSQIKNLDSTSDRGKRQVSLGLATAEGKQLLKGFNFNRNAALNDVLHAPFALDTATGTLVITDFVSAEQLQLPQGATHVSFQNAVLALDFATEVSEVAYSPITNLPINLTPTTLTLTPTSVPTGSGVQLFLILIAFYQEVNGLQYSLKNEGYNVLTIVEVV